MLTKPTYIGANLTRPLQVWPQPAGPVSITNSGNSIVAIFEGSAESIECNAPYQEAVGGCAIIVVRVRELDALYPPLH